jgi:hypothetical protein
MEESSVPDTPWERARAGRRAKHSEQQGARIGGGRRVPGSGNRWNAKGDIRENGVLIDDKFTDADSFTITGDMLKKITVEATQTPPGLMPQLRIRLGTGPTWRLVREDDYLYFEAQRGE